LDFCAIEGFFVDGMIGQRLVVHCNEQSDHGSWTFSLAFWLRLEWLDDTLLLPFLLDKPLAA
jgi:hypothetical protein